MKAIAVPCGIAVCLVFASRTLGDCGRIPVAPYGRSANAVPPVQPPLVINNSSTNNLPNNIMVPAAQPNAQSVQPQGGGGGGGFNPADLAPLIPLLFADQSGNLFQRSQKGLVQVQGRHTLPSVPHPRIDPREVPTAKPTYAEVAEHFSSNPYFIEPNQQAVIGWNGSEEVLILSTDDRSLFGDTVMLSVLPVPGKPLEIAGATADSFKAARALVSKAIADKIGEEDPTAKLVLEAKVGIHDLFAIRVDPDDAGNLRVKLQSWLDSYLASRYGDKKVGAIVTEGVADIISHYIRKDFQYFIFDLVVVPANKKVDDDRNDGKVPLLYRFESKYVYFPLRISGAGGKGETTGSLVVFTEGLLRTKSGPEQFGVYQRGDIATVDIGKDRLSRVDPRLSRLFRDVKSVKGRIYNFEGRLESFKEDIELTGTD